MRLAIRTRFLAYLRTAVTGHVRDALQPLRQDLGTVQKQLGSASERLTAVSERLERLEGTLAGLCEQAARTESTLAGLSEQAARAERTASQVKFMIRLDEKHADQVARLDSLLDENPIIEHVQRAIAAAPLQLDPFPHIVVQDLFPGDFYKLLRSAIPPPAFFSDRDPIKQNLKLPLEFGPKLSVRVLSFLDAVLAHRGILPAVKEKFDQPLERHYDTLFGPEFRQRASDMPQSTSNGRVMLRRPGYHLSAHRDPKRSMITCLLYLAGSKDSDAYGTQIFRVIDDREASYTQTYYPEQDGRQCELVRMVPFRPNTMLVFLNSSGAHGATIPADAPATLERYSYQFYIGPSHDDLNALIRDLPGERQIRWRAKKDLDAEYA